VGDGELVARLRAGDEGAFVALVERYHRRMITVALGFVPNRSVAEEVVQDTWVAVLKGIDGFEERSSLATWIFRILVNRAKTTGVRESRQQPVADVEGPAVDPSRFGPGGAWQDPPTPWTEQVEDRLYSQAMAGRIRGAVEDLPPTQRRVVTLRDLEGLSAQDTCEILGISEGNMRVLLHRGRARIRQILATELGGR
jgi:RNA polymerase sigma-70 factor (ECF subfamily)